MNEDKIVETWDANAGPWARAVESGRILSRVTVTNSAILEAVGPGRGRILDLGCGEGWLARALAAKGWEVTGVDGSPGLIEIARTRAPGEYLCLTYEELGDSLAGREFHKVVANFSLLGETSTSEAVKAAGALLVPGGLFLLQTLHPTSVDKQTDGWREEAWEFLGDLSCTPSPWYYRTLENWIQLLEDTGLPVQEIREPTAPGGEQPASLIIVSQKPIPGGPHPSR